MLEVRAADRNLYLVIKSNITESVVNDERGALRKGQVEQENRASKGSIHSGPQYLSPVTISLDFSSNSPMCVEGMWREREGKKLEVNESELKINFFSMENQRLDSSSHIQGCLHGFTPGLSKVKSLGVAPVVLSTVSIQGRP